MKLSAPSGLRFYQMNLPKSTDELVRAMAAGLSPKFTFFWGHRPSASGSITKSCFSQWWHSPFTVDGVRYPTAEHYMMAAKARLFGDTETLGKILTASGPGQVKALGRSVDRFDENAWCAHRYDAVVEGNLAKFSQNAELKEFLLSTKRRVLVEASPVDRIWGIGLAEDSPDAERPQRWRGLNLLGFALMEVRERLV